MCQALLVCDDAFGSIAFEAALILSLDNNVCVSDLGHSAHPLDQCLGDRVSFLKISQQAPGFIISRPLSGYSPLTLPSNKNQH